MLSLSSGTWPQPMEARTAPSSLRAWWGSVGHARPPRPQSIRLLIMLAMLLGLLVIDAVWSMFP